MTDKQRIYYFRMVSDATKAAGISGTKEREDFRRKITVEALGEEKSSKAFTNADVDKVLGVCQAWIRNADLEPQLEKMNQPRKRLIFAVERLKRALKILGVANPDGYVEAIWRDKVHDGDWKSGGEEVLGHLRMTLTRAVQNRRRQMGMTPRELNDLLDGKTADGEAQSDVLDTAGLVAVADDGDPF